MKKLNYSLLIILVFIVGYVQTIWIPINWILMLVLAVALVAQVRDVSTFAFLSGLILDLFLGRPWGISSLGFLLVALIVFFARRFLQASKWLAVFSLGFLTDWLFNLIFFKRFTWLESLIFACLFLVIYFSLLAKKISQDNGIRLRLNE